MKRIISAILCICIMLTVVAMSISAAPSSTQVSKGVLLYVGSKWNSNTINYYTPTDSELRKLLSVTDEIILIPISTYNRYTDANGQEKQVITQDLINNMTGDMVGNANLLNTIKSEYTNAAAPIMRSNLHIDEYIEDATDLAERLVAINPDVRLWYSVPANGNLHALTDMFSDSWISLVDGVKEAVSEDMWNKNIQGFYYATEDIVTANMYTKFDTTKPDQNFNNPVVSSMKKVSDKVHSYNKNFMWIPYGHVTVSSYTNLGYVANLTNIFDTIIIQPGYFWHVDRKIGVEVIKNSVEQQAVLDTNGNIIGGKKTSDTVIGWEMEIDQNYLLGGSYVTRYNTYVDTFKDFVGQYPTVYYADAPEYMLQLTDEIGEFFGSNESSSSSSTPSVDPGTSSIAPSESDDSSVVSPSSSASSASSSSSASSASSSSTVSQVNTGDAAFPIIAVAALAVVAGASVAISRKRR